MHGRARRMSTAAWITPELVDLFKKAEALRSREGAREAYLDACLDLHQALGRFPWEDDVMDCDDPEPHPTITRPDDYRKAHKLYRALAKEVH